LARLVETVDVSVRGSFELPEECTPVNESPSISPAGGEAAWLGAVRGPDAPEYFLDVIDSCWGLLNAGGMDIADRIVSSFLPDFTKHVRQQPEASQVAAQGLRLLSVIRHHHMKLQEKLVLSQGSLEWARRSGNPDVIASSLMELGSANNYSGRVREGSTSYIWALSLAESVQPLIRSQIHATAAAAYAQQNLPDEAQQHIQLARETFPANAETTPHYLSADYGLHMLVEYEGLTYLNMGRPAEAFRVFTQFRQQPAAQNTPARNLLEIINLQGLAAILLNQREQYAETLKMAISGSVSIGSRKRFDEAVSMFQDLAPPEWRQDPSLSSILASLRRSPLRRQWGGPGEGRARLRATTGGARSGPRRLPSRVGNRQDSRP
jgi:tetratricopeptide (TPR) repeat protein